MKKGRFTLLELLVVTAIIGMLLTILIPSLSNAREKAKEAVCMSNRRQHMNGVALFAKNNNSHFPQTRGRPWRLEYAIRVGSYILLGRTKPYTGDEVMGCPSVTSERYAGSSEINSFQRRWLSYNSEIWRHRNESQTFENTTEKAILGDLIQNSGTLGTDHRRKVKLMAYIDGHTKILHRPQLTLMQSLVSIPSKNQYKLFWDSINDIE